MSDDACCACLRVAYKTEDAGHGQTTGHWECVLCGNKFIPARLAEALLAAHKSSAMTEPTQPPRPANVCQHDQLARSCERCEDASGIAALKAENERLRERVRVLEGAQAKFMVVAKDTLAADDFMNLEYMLDGAALAAGGEKT